MCSSEQKKGGKLTSSKPDPFLCNAAAYTEVKALYHKLIFFFKATLFSTDRN